MDETPSAEHIEQFFKYGHLSERLQAVSKPFADLSQRMLETLPRNPERTVMLRKLLEAKDAAVRALIATALLVLLVPLDAFAQTVLVPPPVAPTTPVWVSAILQYIVVPMIPIIGGLLVAALAKLAQFLHGKQANSKLAGAFAVATDFIEAAFDHMRAGIEPDLKLALADGTLDASERAALVAKLVTLVKAELPASIMGILGGALGPALETWLSGKAGQAVQAVVEAKAAPGELAPSPA